MHNGRTAHTLTQPAPRVGTAQAPAQLQQEGINGFSKVLATVLVVPTPESLGPLEQDKARREKLCVAI